PNNVVGRPDGLWSVFALRPENGVEEHGSLVHGQIFTGKEYRQFRRSLGSNRSVCWTLGFFLKNVTDGVVLSKRSRVEAKIGPPFPIVRKDRFNDGTYKLTILPIDFEINLDDNSNTRFKSGHKILEARQRGLISFDCPVLNEVIEAGECRVTFAFYDLNQ